MPIFLSFKMLKEIDRDASLRSLTGDYQYQNLNPRILAQ